ncbi:hypothetical protein AMS68_000823 [Peltaster fructicola]|uniref:Palmitoyltransferase n=1 Tax=Peltaster fructicola TaxID=286661 RepID=A0A6H0XKS0_9PEZI|nr:hypothetical protein AMS68_000823 [Peltaster fructicola]
MSAISEEDDMALLAAESNKNPPFHHRRRSWARRVERICYKTLSYFPLTFVYGLTTWAVWVQMRVCVSDVAAWLAYPMAALGLLLYILANVSYTIAVFTPPGSPLDLRGSSAQQKRGYEGLPTYEHEEESRVPETMSTVTAKSTGKQRYCKKCKTIKPDRTHHCSTCGQCVLKMDHHCPWLATCVGLHNYKAFLLFLIYTSLFCWVCFGVSIEWVWTHLMENVIVDDGWKLVNTIMLSVLGGIIGLVLSGFTGWHIWLALTGTTTIESLEKTRYLSPVRKSMQRRFEPGRNYIGQDRPEEQQTLTEHLREMHVNALPGVLRPEEGEVHTSALPQASARGSLQQSYASLESQREHDRYESYLDERDSEKLPNAFDLGWRRNLVHLFGDNALLWALPVCNTSGDGWHWEVSQKWQAAREDVSRERAQRQRENAQWDQHNPVTFDGGSKSDLHWVPGQGFVPSTRREHDTTMRMQSLDRRKPSDDMSHATNSDEGRGSRLRTDGTEDWNDIPDDLFGTEHARSRSSGRNKHD